MPRWFVTLWCLGMIFHCASREFRGLELLVTAFATWAIITPDKKGVLLLLFATQIASWWQQMPASDNHWLFAAVVNLILSVSLMGTFFTSRKTLFSAEALNTLRFCTLCLYGIAVLHKLNWAFLDPSVSCAIIHGEKTLRQNGWLTSDSVFLKGLGSWVIVGVLLLEASVPLFLALPRTWGIGIFLGMVFHISTHMPNFGSLVFAIYLLFIPEDIVQKWNLKWLNSLIVAALLLVGLQILASNGYLHRFWLQFSVFSWMGASLLLALAILALFLRGSRTRDFSITPKISPYWVIVTLFILNGLSPYLGLKDSTSLAMWSNLNATRDLGNHLFISTRYFKVFPYVDTIESVTFPNWLEKKLVSVNAAHHQVPEPCLW